jgi:hypothetical protein
LPGVLDVLDRTEMVAQDNKKKPVVVKIRSHAVRVKSTVRAGDLYMQNPRGGNTRLGEG